MWVANEARSASRVFPWASPDPKLKIITPTKAKAKTSLEIAIQIGLAM